MLSGFGASEMTVEGPGGRRRRLHPEGPAARQHARPAAHARGQGVQRTSGRRRPRPTHAAERPAVLDHLELAPFGFLQLRDGPASCGRTGRPDGCSATSRLPTPTSQPSRRCSPLTSHTEPGPGRRGAARPRRAGPPDPGHRPATAARTRSSTSRRRAATRRSCSGGPSPPRRTRSATRSAC